MLLIVSALRRVGKITFSLSRSKNIFSCFIDWELNELNVLDPYLPLTNTDE